MRMVAKIKRNELGNIRIPHPDEFVGITHDADAPISFAKRQYTVRGRIKSRKRGEPTAIGDGID